MKTINIKGKEYVPVVERVKEFHLVYPNGEIQTEIYSNNDTRVVVRAVITTGNEFIIFNDGKHTAIPINNRSFTGHSQAEWGKGMMGGVALEVAETSAIGRALGFANIGLIDGIASADEMRKVKKVEGDNIDDELGF